MEIAMSVSKATGNKEKKSPRKRLGETGWEEGVQR